MGGTKPTFTPYPTFQQSAPVKDGAVSLAAVGRCRISPETIPVGQEEFQAIVSKNIEQSKVNTDGITDPTEKDAQKKLKKKYMKQGVAMAQSYLISTLQLDPSIVNVEIMLTPEMIIESDGCIVACFLDAACDKVVVSSSDNDDAILLEALNVARVPKERLIAQFDFDKINEKVSSSESTESKDNIFITNVLSLAGTISVAYLQNILVDACKDLMMKIINLSSDKKHLTVVIQIPSDETQDLSTMAGFTSAISKFCYEKESPRGTVTLIDPSPLQLGETYVACIRTDRPDGLFTTVVCTRANEALGLVYSSKESVIAALECGRGVYYSRSRNGLWRKGDTSGHYQSLHRIDVDCDGDALRFMVTQRGEVAAFCHLNTLTCWGEPHGIRHLEGTLKARMTDAPEGSYTKRLFDDPELLRDKLVEEAQELSEADTKQHAAEELSDVLYFAMVKAAKVGISIDDAIAELDKRARKVTRRKGDSKAFRIEAGNAILKKE